MLKMCGIAIEVGCCYSLIDVTSVELLVTHHSHVQCLAIVDNE